jgi:hypothetical protein
MLTAWITQERAQSQRELVLAAELRGDGCDVLRGRFDRASPEP